MLSNNLEQFFSFIFQNILAPASAKTKLTQNFLIDSYLFVNGLMAEEALTKTILIHWHLGSYIKQECNTVWPDLTKFWNFCKIVNIFGNFWMVHLLFYLTKIWTFFGKMFIYLGKLKMAQYRKII